MTAGPRTAAARARRGPDLPLPPAPVKPPIRIGPDRRRLLDADGKAVLIQGDAAWSLIVNTTLDGAIHYLDERRALGFNTIMVNLLEHLFSSDPPRNLAGDEPFERPGDLGAPQEAYFAHADRVLDEAAARGFLVILAPTYLGYPIPHYPGYDGRAEGWYDEILGAGIDGCRAWGEYLGRRFGRFDNLVWCIGGDRNPGQARAGLDAVANGIRAAGGQGLFTAHVHPESSPVDVYPGADWLDLNLTYTYGIVHRALVADWLRTPSWPFLLVESTYEGEHDASALQIRRQAWWSVLCGGTGHVMGNKPMWMFGPGWEDDLRSPGAIAMSRWGGFLRDLPWSDLEPDLDATFVTGGLGEARGLDRVTAAVTRDADLGVAYLPVRRPVTIEPSRLAGGGGLVEWFEPATGRRVTGETVAGRGAVVLRPPFRADAVLTIRSS